MKVSLMIDRKKLEAMAKELAKDIKSEADLGDLSKQLMKLTVETALGAELDEQLGYSKHDASGNNSGNSRNGTSKKHLKGNHGDIELEIPRDRNGLFEPQFIKKGQTRLANFDSQILSLYAKGMSTRDIVAAFKEMYDADVSATLVSNVTNAVIEKVIEWQNRPLAELYPIVYLDCIVVKIRQNKKVINKSIYLALGINLEGHKELLGMWISETEGAKFWLSVVTELSNRGVKDIFVAAVDGLKGFPEAINAVFSKTKVQLCIVHMVRNSMKFVGWKERKKVAGDLKLIYSSATEDEARLELDKFAEKWDDKFPAISKSWKENWENLIAIFDFPKDIRKIIYTTNAIESLNSVIRKAVKNRKIFPTDESAMKVIYLATEAASKKWTMPIRDWAGALNWFTIEYEERMPK